MNPEHIALKCDVLVIGGGGSGALAGLEASNNDRLKIIIVSRVPVSQSGLTPTGNGGTAASSSVENLIKTMVTAGNFLNDQNVFWFMLTEIQNALEKLKALGVTVTPLHPGGVCVPGVETLSIVRRESYRRPNIDLLEDVLVTRLINSDGKITGAVALNLTTAKLFRIDAKAVIVATGEISGELYSRSSNNPFGVSADASGIGHVMAYLAGADLIDMEMMAFVPLPDNPGCKNLRDFPEFWQGPYRNRHGGIVESNIHDYLGGSYSYLFLQKICRELEKGNGPIYVDRETSRTRNRPTKSRFGIDGENISRPWMSTL